MNNNCIPIQQILTGENAFYRQEDYQETTSQELASSKPLKTPAYRYNTESKIWRAVKDIFSIIIFPIGLCRLLHRLVGKIVVPASTPVFLGYSSNHANENRKDVDLTGSWKVKRISVRVDGYTIDAAILGKESTLGNGRWVLASNGNAEFYEEKLRSHSFKHILSKLDGNAIVFNYPGVGSSSGMPNRKAMAKAYRAMLSFLEDQNNGIGAKEIIGYGHSIGGGVQGDALRSHQLKQDVKYVFVKSRTFSSVSSVISHSTFWPLGLFAKIFGWNISSVKSSKSLEAPEIILQTASVSDYEDILKHPEKIVHDKVIPGEASLAKKLLEDGMEFAGKKCFMGIPENHVEALRQPEILVNKINEMLRG